ncbi:S8 family serine peptidase [Streptomyces sp. NPDC001941]|uniref:S8 family peptidase n=1 Tax=Streptomyces sp. NPDC001941 TaxID=3154659 RepID=UPI003333DEB0
MTATAVLAMAAGASIPATAATDAPSSTTRTAPSGRAGDGKAAPAYRVPLVTGDVAEVTSGRVTGFTPAPGREDIPVSVRSERGHDYVVPVDAQRLIAEGKADKRLFDATGLASADARKAYAKGLKVIVGYRGAAAAARAEVREAGSTRVRRGLASLNAEAVTTPAGDLPRLWEALTDTSGPSVRTTGSGVDRIWLDGVVKARLDVSVPQIGADKVWAAGYDGKGVKVAVLDTGVDETHPDLAGQQIVEKNFSDSPDNKDRQGHGTHVASTIAGKGAKSGGKYKGVAPGARIIDGKVLGDTGSGAESDIVVAIDWAVSEGADVVNLSLGGPDSPGTDPLEESINRHTEADGVLFAIAAGNEGPGAGTVGSPGAADGALTVGAVDSADKTASFSSRGPRVGDGAIKPDVTAPGVDITAASAPGSAIAKEYGENPEGYVTISGTSMATPHVAGAAALLKQRHPDWKADRLKGVLTGSAKDTGFAAYEQGAGRIQADRAVAQGVHAAPVSLNFGEAAWPHDDDQPLTRTLTYRNEGAAAVTLGLTATGTGPKGEAAPAGMFTVSPATVTVPAGGTADVTVTADTSVEAADGQYSGAVVASGDGQSVRSAFVVKRDVASYAVELSHLGRDGKAAAHFQTYVTGLTGDAAGVEYAVDEKSDTTTLRLPVGEYSVSGMILADRSDSTKGTDWIAQPKLKVDKEQKVTLDARTAKPVDITVPDRAATQYQAYMAYEVQVGYSTQKFGWLLASYRNLRAAHLGPDVTDGTLKQVWDADFDAGDTTQYALVFGGPVQRLATGFTRHVQRGELARLDFGLGEAAPGKDAWISVIGWTTDGPMGYSGGHTLTAPRTQRIYVSTAEGAAWTTGFEQLGDTLPNGWQLTDSRYSIPRTAYRAGRTYGIDFNTGAFGPVLDADHSLVRSSNTLYAFVKVFSDGDGHDGYTTLKSAHTTLTRDGEVLADSDEELDYQTFKLPAEDGSYTLSTTASREAKIGRVGSRVDASWTFRSKDGDKTAPVSVARFHPYADLESTVRAGLPVWMPVEVQGAAAGDNLKSLTVQASYDNGVSWRKVPLLLGKALLVAPAKGKGVALRADIVDKQGNTSTVTVFDAFLGR